MGGVCTVLETLVAGGMVGEGIAQTVIKANIENLLQPHEEEFKLMNDLHGFVNNILNQRGFVTQLNSGVMFGNQNWNYIQQDLSDKNDFLVSLLQNFPDMSTSKFSYTMTEGIMFGATCIALGYSCFNMFVGKGKAQISSDYTVFKNWFKSCKKSVRDLEPQIEMSELDQNGKIIVKEQGKNISQVSAAQKQPGIEKAQAQELSGGKSKIVIGFRVLLLAAAVYGFYLGIQSIEFLQAEYYKYKDLFSDGGKFEKSEEGCIDLMAQVASDFFTLANSARATLIDCKNMFVIKAITTPIYYKTNIKYAKQVNPITLGLTDDFINYTKSLINSCNTITAGDSTKKQKLQQLVKVFNEYNTKANPNTVFLNSSITLSQATGQYSLIAEDIFEGSDNVTKWLNAISFGFVTFRMAGFSGFPVTLKQSLDGDVMNNAYAKYCSIFGYKLTSPDKQTTQNKKILFCAIISFADTFYYDDPTGATLFGMNIAAALKSGQSYSTILNQVTSKDNIIPISDLNQADEDKEIAKWTGYANALNASEGYKFWTSEQVPTPVYRFLRIQATKKGKKNQEMTTFEGIKLKANFQVYLYQQNIMTGAQTLVKTLD